MKRYLLLTLLFLAACSPSTTAEPTSYPAPDVAPATAQPAYPSPDTPVSSADPSPYPEPMPEQLLPATGEFPLTLAQPATMPDGATITLIRLEDSRCPPDVTCVWAGELAAEVEIATAVGLTETLRLTTLEAVVSNVLGGHLLQVITAEPQPLSTDNVAPEAYKLVIGRTESQTTNGVYYLDSVDVSLMESFPLQASARLVGNFADGCTSLADVQVVREGNQFTLTPIVTRPADMMCTEALVPFEENVSLDIQGLPAGTYTVVVGEISAEFTLDVDNE